MSESVMQTWQSIETSTSVFGNGRISTHAWPMRMPASPASWLPSVQFWARSFRGAKFPKMGDFLPWTPMNRHAKFDAACFILGGEICNRTNKQTKQNCRNRYIHTLSVGMCG